MGIVEKKTQGIDNKFNNLKLAGKKKSVGSILGKHLITLHLKYTYCESV